MIGGVDDLVRQCQEWEERWRKAVIESHEWERRYKEAVNERDAARMERDVARAEAVQWKMSP